MPIVPKLNDVGHTVVEATKSNAATAGLSGAVLLATLGYALIAEAQGTDALPSVLDGGMDPMMLVYVSALQSVTALGAAVKQYLATRAKQAEVDVARVARLESENQELTNEINALRIREAVNDALRGQNG